ncbi:MAG: hypothetical protein AAGE52_13210 [Myxococcota bacterium]
MAFLVPLILGAYWLLSPSTWTRIETGADGVTIKRLRGQIHIRWNHLVDARVARVMTLTLANGSPLTVPRRANGYLAFVDVLHERRLLRVPDQVTWSTAPFYRRIFVTGTLVTGLAIYLPDFGPAVFTLYGPGVGLMLYSLFGWSRWEADSNGLRWSNWFWSGAWPRSAIAITRPSRSLTGYPATRVVDKPGRAFTGRECPAELLPYVMPNITAYRRPYPHARRPRVRHPWIGWSLYFGLLMLFREVDTSWFVGGALFVAACVYLICGPNLILRFHSNGLERWTFFGRVFEPASAFDRFEDDFLIRSSERFVFVALCQREVDWLTGRWFPMRIDVEPCGYRSPAPRANKVFLSAADYPHGERRDLAACAPTLANHPA